MGEDLSWDELLEKLYGLRRFGMKPGLERIGRALEQEGCREPGYQTVFVGGTNGKGTVASMLAAVLQGHGKRVGLFTSPHLLDVRERFRVDGAPLSRQAVEPVLRHILKEYAGAPGVGLTFFEMTTLAAAMLFQRAEVDIGIFEVGMGGRLDGVNALEPDLSIVTTIGRDHTDYLGDEIGQIAKEKAGIFRPGKPVVVGQQEYEEAVESLQEVAREVGSSIFVVDKGAPAMGLADLVGRHRETALLAAKTVLGEAEFNQKKAEQGLFCWRWPGRFEERELEPWGRRVIIDAAHNPAGVDALRARLRARAGKVSGVVWGMMGDKDAQLVGELLMELGAPVWGALIDNERARGEEELARVVPKNLWQGAFGVKEAWTRARERTEGDLLVFGSIYLLGELYEALGVRVEDLVVFKNVLE